MEAQVSQVHQADYGKSPPVLPRFLLFTAHLNLSELSSSNLVYITMILTIPVRCLFALDYCQGRKGEKGPSEISRDIKNTWDLIFHRRYCALYEILG